MLLFDLDLFIVVYRDDAIQSQCGAIHWKKLVEFIYYFDSFLTEYLNLGRIAILSLQGQLSLPNS